MLSMFLLSNTLTVTVEMLVKVWENSKSCGNTICLQLLFPQHFLFSQTSTQCFYSLIRHMENMVFISLTVKRQFLMEKRQSEEEFL